MAEKRLMLALCARSVISTAAILSEIVALEAALATLASPLAPSAPATLVAAACLCVAKRRLGIVRSRLS
jgi:hypothetical protein